ncbi:hypothetical protein F4775DRAFT_565129, partial [Biscogniauxia sp. FL1348]
MISHSAFLGLAIAADWPTNAFAVSAYLLTYYTYIDVYKQGGGGGGGLYIYLPTTYLPINYIPRKP